MLFQFGDIDKGHYAGDGVLSSMVRGDAHFGPLSASSLHIFLYLSQIVKTPVHIHHKTVDADYTKYTGYDKYLANPYPGTPVRNLKSNWRSPRIKERGNSGF